jgi:hypothetical protein
MNKVLDISTHQIRKKRSGIYEGLVCMDIIKQKTLCMDIFCKPIFIVGECILFRMYAFNDRHWDTVYDTIHVNPRYAL